MDDRMEAAVAALMLFLGILVGVGMTLSGLKAEGLLLEMLGMDLEAARVAAAFGVSSALTLLLAWLGLCYIRSGISILRKLHKRRNQGAEDLTTEGGNEHEAERKD